MAAKKRGEIPNPFDHFGSLDNGTPVEQQASIPVSQQDNIPVEHYTGKPVYQHTSKPALKKYTYYLTEAQDMKLEQIRLARRVRGVNIDKSALVREAIDLLQESEVPRPVAIQSAPVEQKTPRTVEVEVQPPVAVPQDDLVHLQTFADLHAVNRNEAMRLWSVGMITGTKQGTGRQQIIMLAANGRHDFWVQFHETQGFRACDLCPHAL